MPPDTRLAALFVAVLGMGSVPALAASQPKCTSNAAFLVVEAPHKDDAGNSYIVRDNTAAPKPACSTKAAKGDYVVGSKDDPFYLLKLVGPYLLIDAGTGPDRDLGIYDLKARKAVFTGPYSDEDIAIDAAKAVFWTRAEAKPTKKTCPGLAAIEKDGLTPVLEVKVSFDFASGSLSKATQTRCRATQ